MSMAERDETMDEFIETALAVFEGEYCGRCAKRGEGVFCDRAKFQTAGAAAYGACAVSRTAIRPPTAAAATGLTRRKTERWTNDAR